MAKFCGKCGSPLDEHGLCPKCESSKLNTKIPNKKNKKVLFLIITIVALCVASAGLGFAVHKGVINLPFSHDNGTEEESTTENQSVFSAETVYEPVLETYREAFKNNYYTDQEDDWDDENEYDITKTNPEMKYTYGGVQMPIYYSFVDISSDNVPEMIIGVGNGNGNGCHIVDMFGYENGEVSRLFSVWSFGSRGEHYIYPNGIIGSWGSGGASYSGESYYLLEKNSATPKQEVQLNKEYTETAVKCFIGSGDTQQEITESEYASIVSKYGKKIEIKWIKLCESKIYEAEFSVRGDSGINRGYQQIFVTGESADELTAAYREIGDQDGYPVYCNIGSVFQVKKGGNTSNIKWTDDSGNEYTGTISYQNDCFNLTFKTSSSKAAIKECSGTELKLKNNSSNSNNSQPATTVTTTVSPSTNFTPNSLWATFVNNEWIDEEGNRLKFTQNITYYKLKPNAVHSTYDYYMGTLSTTNSKGYYYGHYHIDDDNKLRIEFINWPTGDFGLLQNDSYVWDPTLQKENSWCITSDGMIKFSQGNGELCNKTYHS